MDKWRQRLKIGWYGWTFIGVTSFTLFASTIFFFNLFNLSFTALLTGEPVLKVVSADKFEKNSAEKVSNDKEETQEAINPEKFVAEMHNFYNETTGYGAIANLNWDQQTEQAEKVVMQLDNQKIATIKNRKLQSDLKTIKKTATTAINDKKTDSVRKLHRLFHDLDIALNNSKDNKIWGLTKTLGKDNK